MPETGGTYYDRQEVRNPADREASTFHALPGLLRHALDNAPYFAEQLAGIEPDAIASRVDLARLPVLRKSELNELQSRIAPFGRLTATPLARLARIFASPGPIYDPEGDAAPTIGASPGPCTPQASARATSSTTASPTT